MFSNSCFSCSKFQAEKDKENYSHGPPFDFFSSFALGIKVFKVLYLWFGQSEALLLEFAATYIKYLFDLIASSSSRVFRLHIVGHFKSFLAISSHYGALLVSVSHCTVPL